MTNAYYNRSLNPLPTQRVGSSDLKNEFQSVANGFDAVTSDAARSVKLPAGTADQTINLSAVSRANLVLAFDASGNITAISYGRWRGDWATATAYVVSDYFRDPVSKNVYAVVAGHTSGVLATDISAGRVQLAINVADVEAEKLAAENAAVTATEKAVIATDQANAARAIANFAGVWSTLSGALNKPATVYHAGKYWVLVNNLANVAASQPGVSADWLVQGGGGIETIAYGSRADLRSATPSNGDTRLVDGLGLFVFFSGSDEPDDDESCFATASGRWLLEAPHWDVVDAWQLPDDAIRDESDEDEPVRFASSFAARVLSATYTNTVASVAGNSTTTQAVAVLGAAPGDAVIVTPSAPAASKPDGSVFGVVTAADTVTLHYAANSAATVYFNTSGAWRVIVLKG